MADEKHDLEKVLHATPIDIIARETAGIRSHYPSSYGYGDGYGSGEQKIHLRELWRTVRKRKWLIVTIVFVITTLVTIEMYRTKDIFQASTMIEVGKDTSRLGSPGGNIFGDDYDPFYMVNMKTKMLMVKSHALLESVVVENRLDQNPRFLGAGGKKSVWEALKLMGAKVGITDKPISEEPATNDPAAIITSNDSGPKTADEKDKIERCISMLSGGVGVEPVKETRALKIYYSHADPEIAAEVTNAVANKFLTQNFEAKTQKFTEAARWLSETSNQLKSKLREAEEALEAYTREHGMIFTDKDGTLTITKLQRLHEQAMKAEYDRVLKESLYQEVKEGRVKENAEAYADLLYKTSPKMVDLQKQLGDLETQKAEMSNKFGDDNPKLKEVNLRIAAIQEQIKASQGSLEEKLKTEYERAVRDEEKLKKLLAQAKAEAMTQNQAGIQYNLLKQEVDMNKQLYQDYLNKTNQAEAQKVEQQNNLRIIEAAEVPGSPVSPRRMFTIMVAFLLSAGVGLGLAFFLEYLDNTIKTVEDVSRYAQLPALSVIPAVAGSAARRLSSKGKRALAATTGGSGQEIRNSQLVSLDTRSSAAEAYRVLRTSVLLSAAGQPPKTILVTSGQPGEGKTTTAINTAISLSQLGASVLIIDCDLRRPTTHKVLGVDHIQGLSTYLSRSDVKLDDVIQKLSIANLSLLPCGPIPPNPAELIISDRMKDMLKELADRYDHIIIDSPPLINVTDPVILSTMVDGVILVVHGGKSTRDIVRRARQELSTVGAKIFGVVLNNVDLRREGYDKYYYYRYYSGYGQDSVQDNAEASTQ
jgi:capsular exopolysaccharide synthesis family protein